MSNERNGMKHKYKEAKIDLDEQYAENKAYGFRKGESRITKKVAYRYRWLITLLIGSGRWHLCGYWTTKSK
jgi:hypothetical protein